MNLPSLAASSELSGGGVCFKVHTDFSITVLGYHLKKDFYLET